MLPAPVGRSGNSLRFARAKRQRGVVVLLTALGAVTLAACGGGERQDADEPEATFPVQITESEFPNRQRLAETSNLVLGVMNAGDETIPDLAITISTDPDANDAFSVVSRQAGLADPSRSVWILENGFPRYVDETTPAGADAAQTKTFAFGPLEPGETKNIVWSLTPVQAGTYTVDYRIAAGLEGKAKAVTNGDSVPEGEFVVRISDVPPQTRVDDAGNVVPIDPNDITGQAGSRKQRNEVQGNSGQ